MKYNKEIRPAISPAVSLVRNANEINKPIAKYNQKLVFLLLYNMRTRTNEEINKKARLSLLTPAHVYRSMGIDVDIAAKRKFFFIELLNNR